MAFRSGIAPRQAGATRRPINMCWMLERPVKCYPCICAETVPRLVATRALPFGFGRKKEIIDDEKEDMWRAQQEILKARRQGKTMEGVSERRAEAKEFWAEKEKKKKRIRDMLERGERPPPEKNQPYGENDEGMQGGIIIPLAPFGIPKYDNGERFDLKAPYTDVGWVDEDADPFKWAKNLFGGKKDTEAEDGDNKGKSKRR